MIRYLLLATLLLGSGHAARAADLAGTLAAQGQFGKLIQAAKAAGLDGILAKPGPYTIFAPTDAAFQALPPNRVAELMKPENKAELAKVLSYHMIIGQVGASEWKGRKVSVKSAIGLPLTIEGDGAQVMVNGVRASKVDLGADNGVIHVIDQVLLPPTPIAPRT